MATSVREHIVPAEGETPKWEAVRDGIESVNDIVPVANATARAQLLTDLTGLGQAPTAARPLYVRQGDTGDYWLHNGTAWVLQGPARASYAASGSALGTIAVPASNIPDVNAREIRKTGKANFFTTTGFGNEYSIVVTFDVPFPTALLYVNIMQIHTGSAVAYAGAVATDSASKTDFRVVYVGGSAATNRAFLWEAVGY